VEDSPGLAVWLGHLPRVSLEPVRLRFERRGDEGMIDGLDSLPPEDSVFLLLADPFTFPTDSFVSHLNSETPSVRVIGGMASGAQSPGASRLFFQGQALSEGAVGVVMRGDVDIATVVSQGCRPIGEIFRVTKGNGNLLMELDGRPALRRLEEVYSQSNERDQVLMRRGVHVGLAIREAQAELGRGDFVIRNVLGADHGSGTLAISDVVEVGKAVQFQVRDAESAREDLRLLLDAQRLLGARPPAGALLFSCNGRGQGLFGSPNHDVSALERAFGTLPVAGFFAQGELGPVSGRNFLHGFTASIALFMRPGQSV
jgi:small ligand-binding sensory domain FIST